jgi:opacity protein-like surface antigen
MKVRLHFRPVGLLLLGSAFCFSTVAFAQNATQDTNGSANNQTNNTASANPPKAVSASGQDEYPDIVEIDPFGGISTYGAVMRGLDTKLVDGGLGGLRIDFNPTRHLGLELWGDFDQANVEFRSSSGLYPAASGVLAGTPLPTYSFGARNIFFGLNPIFNLRPRGSKVQPYLTVGIDGIQFTPTSTAKRLARQPSINSLYYSGNLNDNLQVGLNYGGGVKFHLSDHVGLRLDARGFWSRNPTYDLPNFPDGGIYIPSHDKINGFQGTIGLVFYLGQGKCPPMPPAPPPPPPLPQPSITGGEGTICPGQAVNLHANLTGAPTGHNLTYAWTVNGQAQGGNSPDLSITPPAGGGTLNVQVTVTDTTPPPAPMERPKKFPERCWVQPAAPPPVQPVTATTTLTVTVAPPTISSVTASPSTPLMCSAVPTGDHTAQLTATAQASACGGNLTYAWTVSEGSVTNGNTANATFDASSLNFEGGAQGQTKTVTATVTVTDQTGQTASQSTTITVNCPPQYQRLDDLVFAKNNARVNNCAKRILIDDAAPKVAGGDYDIVLVGHRDTDEESNVGARRRGRRARRGAATQTALDEQRALNAAAVLIGGHGTCANVDPSHVKIDWVGTDQTSEARPGLCGTSNVKERRGEETSAADKNRRVEVYIVPRSSQAMPPAVKNPKPLPDREMKLLGCPK